MQPDRSRDLNRSAPLSVLREGWSRLQGKKAETAVVCGTYVLVAAIIAYLILTLHLADSPWASFDAARFHSMAEAIIAGLAPYVDYVDPKPPLLYFAVALMDLIAPAGSIDIPVMAGLNVASALLIWRIGREDYGSAAGYFSGLLFLVASVFVQGYFLFAEQFGVLFLLCAYISARKSNYALAGLFVGLAVGFKQYAALALIPLLYLMHARGERRYHRLVLPAVAAVVGTFGILYLAYGMEATAAALHWTFSIGPGYLLDDGVPGIPNYRPTDPIGFAANLVGSVAMVLPTLVFAAGSAVKSGFRSPEERTLGLFVLAFLGTLLVRQYLHYWLLLLPFLALIACREFGRTPDRRPGS
ncbi:MAG: glycosyltransferase family 39 protein [Methanomicrobiales archaeon]|nr:glycosyltransferase family 39 protein [Methanomicrobiales archaeon]MDI6876258.1 glycosyltransferase family 39 protein [Methanomicrobiales archaeon]